MPPRHPTRLVLVLMSAVAAGTLATAGAQAQSFLFDFGATGTTTTNPADDTVNFWNNLTTTVGTTSTGQLLDLVTTQNVATAIDLVMISRFASSNANGATTSTLFPSDATSDSLYGNTEVFSGLSNIFPSLKLTSLNPGLLYSFLFYGSRTGASDNRETAYTVAGLATSTVYLNAANNINGTISLANVAPSAAGEITISLAPGPNNNNANHFTYLNVMRVDTVPEPAAGSLLLASALALGLRRRRRR